MNDQGPPPPPDDQPGWRPPGYDAPPPPGTTPPPPGYGAPAAPGYGAPPPPGFGAPQPGQWAPAPPVAGQSNGMAVAALVCGIISFFCLGLLLGIPAVVLGFLGLNKSKELGGTGKGQAIAGIVLGGLATLWSIGFFLLVLLGDTTTTTSF